MIEIISGNVDENKITKEATLKEKEAFVKVAIGREKSKALCKLCSVREAQSYCYGTLDAIVDATDEHDLYNELAQAIDDMDLSDSL